jgi:DNA-binding winged helix-turn-helix (wHTH) protein
MNIQMTSMAEQESSRVSVAAPAFPGRYARFGAFQADLERGELYQNGQRVKVQAKLFQALLVLLSRAGEIVTREEVRRQLWPDASLANLDANVNTTMNKLRQVLGDSADSPVYIETIPRRGYSLLASVEFSDVLGLAAVEVEDTRGNTTPQSEARAIIWSKENIPTLLRVISLLFAGMLLGALLAFIWFFTQAKNQRAANSSKVSASLVILHKGNATKPA